MAATAIVVPFDDLDAVVGAHRRVATTLDPEPGGPFVGMIAALERELPAFPSFGGIHETVVPHLTIAQTGDAPAMQAAKDDVASHLPIQTRVTAVAVMEHLPAGWRPVERIPLSL